MATVRLTVKLWDSVEYQLKQLFEKRITAAAKAHEPLALEAYDAIVPPAVQAILAPVPTAYLNWVDSFSVRLVVKTPKGNTTEANFGFALPEKRPMSREYGRHLIRPETAIHPKLEALAVALRTIEDERDKLITDMHDLWNNYATVNKLAEVWPTVLDYLPKDVLAQYNLKVDTVRTKKEKVLLSDDLAAGLIKARMLKEGQL